MLALSNDGLILAVRDLVKEERRVTRAILDHINEVERRRAYAELGYSSVFDWLVHDLGYSESAAYRRIQAARLLKAVPEAAARLEAGVVSLTTLAKAQTFFRADEKRRGTRISIEEKSQVVDSISSCSGRETERRLASLFPEVTNAQALDRTRLIDDDRVSVQVTFTRTQHEKLKRLGEVLSHSHPGASNAELLEVAIDHFLARKDPLQRKPSERSMRSDTAKKVNALSVRVRNSLIQKSGAQCEYRDPKSRRRCESRHFLEVDHIQPRALGGGNSPSNLRVLCRTHNLLMAEVKLGRETMERYRSHRLV